MIIAERLHPGMALVRCRGLLIFRLLAANMTETAEHRGELLQTVTPLSRTRRVPAADRRPGIRDARRRLRCARKM